MNDRMPKIATLDEWREAAAKSAGSLDQLVWRTPEGIEVKALYTAADLKGLPYADTLPGFEPFVRGPQATMYAVRPWTIRQYAGFSTAAESNAFFRRNLAAGQQGVSVAFDLATHRGYDSDHPRVVGDVGKAGVAIDSVEDMKVLFDGIPLDKVTTSMTINATAAILLALYLAVAEKQKVAWNKVGGTIQNDVLKEYIARGTYVYPPAASMRIITDIFAFCTEHVPKWNTISISGYHIREAGSTAVQEVAFTLANAIAYVEAAIKAGLNIDDFAGRLSFFFNVQNTFFEEVAKYRAARRLWAKIMRERFGAKQSRSWMLRFHSQTAGSSLTAQQPLNNVVRTTIQALAAVCGGTQSLHTNSFDEALSLPTESAARTALRTQQIVAYESGVADTIDPMAGSYFVEALTDEIEARAQQYIEKIDDMGGAVAGIERGFQQREIQQAAYAWQQAVEAKREIVVGVNDFQLEQEEATETLKVGPELEKRQVARLNALRARRDNSAVAKALGRITACARGSENLMPPIIDAVRAYATLGEISDAMREVFGQFHPPTFI
jgi:methylmalonyl-CoA mutase N-terminal domain/subunit